VNTGSYINGKWVQPQSERLVRNINPADTSDVIAEFPAATAADTQRAIEAAQAAFPGWKKTPGPERGRVLWRATEIARRRLDEIARTMTREEGKILKEAKGEALKGISLLEYYAGAGFRISGKTLPSEARDTFTYTLRQPLGIVGLIAPWNFPWAIPVWKSAPALVAGNTVVFKPAVLTPATATILAEIYEEAGLPPGVFNMVVGSGSEVGETSSTPRKCAPSPLPAPMRWGMIFMLKPPGAASRSPVRWGAKMRLLSCPTPTWRRLRWRSTAALLAPPASAVRRLRG
jgi:alpha-ketoglutaric semialdehyde dehydrogenase